MLMYFGANKHLNQPISRASASCQKLYFLIYLLNGFRKWEWIPGFWLTCMAFSFSIFPIHPPLCPHVIMKNLVQWGCLVAHVYLTGFFTPFLVQPSLLLTVILSICRSRNSKNLMTSLGLFLFVYFLLWCLCTKNTFPKASTKEHKTASYFKNSIKQYVLITSQFQQTALSGKFNIRIILYFIAFCYFNHKLVGDITTWSVRLCRGRWSSNNWLSI